MIQEIGYLLLYIAGFGFSDYIVKYYKLKYINYLLYYLFILILGLILINKSEKYDFKIVHYTPDGNLGSLCGNGTRCAIAYAHKKNIIKNSTYILL